MRTDRTVVSGDGRRDSDVESAFARLYAEMLPVLFGFCRARLPQHDAEDVTAEVFRSALQRLTEDPAVELNRSWFLTAARNRIIDRWRRETRWRPRLDLLAATEPGHHDGPEDSPSAVHDALDHLPPTQRAALVLHHLDGYSVAEVGELLDRSPRAVESLLARARRTVRAHVSSIGGEHHAG